MGAFLVRIELSMVPVDSFNCNSFDCINNSKTRNLWQTNYTKWGLDVAIRIYFTHTTQSCIPKTHTHTTRFCSNIGQFFIKLERGDKLIAFIKIRLRISRPTFSFCKLIDLLLWTFLHLICTKLSYFEYNHV